MFQRVTELIVRMSDLAEAEGRVLRRAIVHTGLSLAVIAAATMLGLLGIGFVLAAVWLGLNMLVGPAWSSLVVGSIALGLSCGLLSWARNAAK